MALYFGWPGHRHHRHMRSPMETLMMGDLFDDFAPVPFAAPDLLLQHVLRPAKAGTKKPWIRIFNMRGFTENEINVDINEDSVNIRAKHEDGKDGNIDRYEKVRSVKIPKDIDRDKISCFLNSDGRFFVKGLYIKKQPQQTSTSPEAVQTGRKRNATEENGSGDNECSPDPKKARLDNDLTRVKSLTDFLDAFSGTVDNSDQGKNASDIILIGDDNPHFGTELLVKDIALAPLKDSQEIVEKDGKKSFQVKVNLTEFPPENISIRCQDNTLYVDAKKEVETDGMYKFQEIHKEYAVPRNSTSKEAKATVSDKGLVCIDVPVVEQPEQVEIPITHE